MSEETNYLKLDELPWKIIPQLKVDANGQTQKLFQYLRSNFKKLSDTESFVWKWSPCGRYGIDMSGGRDTINHEKKNCLSVLDTHTLSWQFYNVEGMKFEISRVAFIYWISKKIIVIVELVKDEDIMEETDIVLEFKQSFLEVDHTKKIFKHIESCTYKSEKSVPFTYWYHIFENRLGEPFVDNNRAAWLVFSNAKDCLILIPFVPTSTCYELKYVYFDMENVFETYYGRRYMLDPFSSSHFVPFVYKNDINFFIQIGAVEEENSEFGAMIDENSSKLHHIRVDLAQVLEDYEKSPKIDRISFKTENVEFVNCLQFPNKFGNGFRKVFKNITQVGKSVIISEWRITDTNHSEAKRLRTKIGNWGTRWIPREQDALKFFVIDLNSGVNREFRSNLSMTDVIIPHPDGPMLIFRYKEEYGMCMCELPYFPPFSLFTKATNAVNKCIYIDPIYQKRIPKNDDDSNQNIDNSDNEW